MKTTVEKTAIYGGAFNPPTLAHIQIVEEVLKMTDITHVIISPSGEREDKDFGIDHVARRKLIEGYISLLQQAGLPVSLDDFFFSGKNTGITTTKAEDDYFRKKLGISPHFIFGSDTAENMSWWSNNENRFIEEKLKKIFLQRPGHTFDFEGNGFDNYILLDIPDMLEVSSSLARAMLQTKGDVSGILHPKIEEIIREDNLYT